MRSHIFGLTLLIGTSLVSNAWAVSVPNTARPEFIERQIRVEPRPEVSRKPVIALPHQGDKELKGNVSFELKKVEFEGATVFSRNQLRPFYQKRIGTRITLADLNRIAEDITTYYRNQGYILTRAIVPPQKIDQGVARIRVIEGFASDVQLQGDVGNSGSVLYSYVEKIKQSRPLNAKTLERYLLLMEDLPGVDARAVLQPSPTTPGASQVVVTITRHRFQDTSVSIDNRGTRFLGPVQAQANLAVNNLLGRDDQTSVRVINTVFDPKELKYLEVRHEEQVGAEGTKVILDAAFDKTNPGGSLNVFDIKGDNYVFDIAVSHPILRSRKSNWFVNSDFGVQRVNVEVLGENLYRDNLRVLTAGTAYDFIDTSNAVNRLEANVHKGFSWDAGNGGRGHSRFNGESSFVKTTGNVTRIQPLAEGPYAFKTAVSGQYSFNPLYAAEEFALGGEEFGSAYDPAELTGDSGVAARFELQWNGQAPQFYLPSCQIYGFYDIGKVWNRNTNMLTEFKTASLVSMGVGSRFNISKSLSGNVELAFPRTRSVAAYGEDGGGARLFAGLQYRY